MEEELRAVLLGSADVSAIVGDRINWREHPQGAPWPGIILTVIGSQNGHTMSGPNDLFETRVQADIYADTYGAAKTTARAVLAALDGHRSGGLQGVFHAGSRDGREGGTNEADRPFRVSMDFMTKWSE